MPRQSIKSRKMIRTLLQNGKKFHSPNLTVYLDKSFPVAGGRFLTSFHISTALIPRAVDRNRLRRWLREDLRRLVRQNEFSGAMIVKFKTARAAIEHQKLTDELEAVLSTALKNEN